MAKPAVILVGADKGGVGKTTVSRTLLDYFAYRKIPARAFDTEWPKGTLKRFHPDITDVVDVTAVPDQMKIFDTIESSGTQVTLIDVRAGLMSPTLRALRDIGFLDMAKWSQMSFAVFHILGPSIASLDEIAETAKFLVDARYLLVKNFINNTSFFDWDQTVYNSYFNRIPHAVEITVPKLSEMACEQVEISSVPFATFIANRKANGELAANSFVLRGYVRHWLNTVWAEYDRVRLADMLGLKDSAGPAALPHADASAPVVAPAAPRDTPARPTPGQDLFRKDAAARDPAPRELAPKELAPKDLAPKEPAPKELPPKEPAKPRQTAKVGEPS